MARLQPSIAIFAGLGLFLQVTVWTQTQENPPKPAAPPMELTALDYIQIQQLVAKYAEYIDTCSNNGYDYADLFTADGFFAPFTNGQIGRKSQGREALARVSGGGPNGCTGAGWIRQGVKHIYVNHIINPTPEGASGQVNMLMIGLGGDKNRIEHDGAYYDTYEKTAQGWRFKSRIHHANYIAGGERGGAAATAAQPPAPAQPAVPTVQPGQPAR
jgi:SnoaL-like domain